MFGVSPPCRPYAPTRSCLSVSTVTSSTLAPRSEPGAPGAGAAARPHADAAISAIAIATARLDARRLNAKPAKAAKASIRSTDLCGPCGLCVSRPRLASYGRSRLAELRRVDRDIRLHLGQLDGITTGHPCEGPLERHLDTGDVPIIIEVELRRHAAHRRVGVANDPSEQARLHVEIQRRGETAGAGALENIDRAAGDFTRQRRTPVGEQLPDPARYGQLRVQPGAIQFSSGQVHHGHRSDRRREPAVVTVEGHRLVAELLVDDQRALVGSFDIEFDRALEASSEQSGRALAGIARELRQALGPANRLDVLVENLVGGRRALRLQEEIIGRPVDWFAVHDIERRCDLRTIALAMTGPAADDLSSREVRLIDGVHHLNHLARGDLPRRVGGPIR